MNKPQRIWTFLACLATMLLGGLLWVCQQPPPALPPPVIAPPVVPPKPPLPPPPPPVTGKPVNAIELCESDTPLANPLATLIAETDGLLRIIQADQLPDGNSATAIEEKVNQLCDSRYGAWAAGNKILAENHSWEMVVWQLDDPREKQRIGSLSTVVSVLDAAGNRKPYVFSLKTTAPVPEPAWWPQFLRSRQVYDTVTTALRRLQEAEWKAMPRPIGIQDACELFFSTGDARPRTPSRQRIDGMLSSPGYGFAQAFYELPPISPHLSPRLPELYASCLAGKIPLPPREALERSVAASRDNLRFATYTPTDRAARLSLIHFWIAYHLNDMARFFPQPPTAQQTVNRLVQEMQRQLAIPPATAEDWLGLGSLGNALTSMRLSSWKTLEKPPFIAMPQTGTSRCWGEVYVKTLDGVTPWMLELARLRKPFKRITGPPRSPDEIDPYAVGRPWRPETVEQLRQALRRTQPLPVPADLAAPTSELAQANQLEPKPVPVPGGIDSKEAWVDGLLNLKMWLDAKLVFEIEIGARKHPPEPMLETLSGILVERYQGLAGKTPAELVQKEALRQQILALRSGDKPLPSLPRAIAELPLASTSLLASGMAATPAPPPEATPDQAVKGIQMLIIRSFSSSQAEAMKKIRLSLQGQTLAGPLNQELASTLIQTITNLHILNQETYDLQKETIGLLDRSVRRWAQEPQPAPEPVQEQFRLLVLQLEDFLVYRSQTGFLQANQKTLYGDSPYRRPDFCAYEAPSLVPSLVALLKGWREAEGWTGLRKPRCLAHMQSAADFRLPLLGRQPLSWFAGFPVDANNSFYAMTREQRWHGPFYCDDLLVRWSQDPAAMGLAKIAYERQASTLGGAWGLIHIVPDPAWVDAFAKTLAGQGADVNQRSNHERWLRPRQLPTLIYVVAGEVSQETLSPSCTAQEIGRLLEMIRDEWQKPARSRQEDALMARIVVSLQHVPWRALPMPEWLRQAKAEAKLDDEGKALLANCRQTAPATQATTTTRTAERRQPAPMNRKALADFIEKLLAELDADGDGLLSDNELQAAKCLPPCILQRLSLSLLGYNQNHDGRLSQAERAAIREPRTANLASVNSQVAYADADKDGKLNRQEQIRMDPERLYFFNTVVKWMTLFWMDGGEKLVPGQLFRQADRDGNGWLDTVEIKSLDSLSLAWFDANGNGILDPEERSARTEQARREDAVACLCPEADANHDDQFDPAEMEQATALLLPLYDLDQNGRIDPGEWRMIIRDSRQAIYERRQKGAVPTPKWRNANAAACRQQELAILERHQEEIEAWLFDVWGREVNPAWNNAKRQRLWQTQIAPYDANHNGRLDGLETCRFWDGEIHLEGLNPLQDPPAWLRMASQSENAQNLLCWPLLFSLVDTDADGLCSPAERQALQERANISGRQRQVESLAILFFPELLGNPDEFGRAQQAAALARMKDLYDLDHDGDFSRQELAAIHQDLFAKLDYPGLWGPVLAEQADLDHNGQVSTLETETLQTILLFAYDTNENGRFDLDELGYITADLQTLYRKHAKANQQRQKDLPLLQRYDLNGNGQLDPDERARAEADTKTGIRAPARDE